MVNAPLGSQTNRLVFISPVLSQPLRISGTAMVDMFASFNKSSASVGAVIADYAPTSFVKASRNGDGITTGTATNCWGDSFGIDDACYRVVNKTTQTINPLTGTGTSGYRVTRGILDAVNRNDYSTDSPLVPGQQYELKFPLLATDYTFPAGHRIGITLVSNYSGYGISNTTAPTAQITVDTLKSKVTLPIVGGYAAAVATGAIPDTDPPTLTLPAPVTVEATGPLTAVTYGAPGASDGQDPNATASCLPASGSQFPVGVTSVACEARDGANNVTTGSFAVTVVDTTAPAITIDAPVSATVTAAGQPGNYALGSSPLASYSCSDAASGPPSCVGPVPSGSPFDTGTVGSHTFTVNAVDLAGNPSSASRTYNVYWPGWSSFNSPIDNGLMNEVKAGGSIPVKFSLGGNMGLAIFAAGYPLSRPVTCDLSVPSDPVEGTVNAGGSSLTFDSGQYVYIWKTDKKWAGTCRELTVKLIDNTSHTALFRFK